jgi:predicted GH43/DUF377 family glycosyl hydrolase
VRGGTPALLVDGEYLAFSHSVMRVKSNASKGILRKHYFIGAYTFSKDPPFHLLTASTDPIVGKEFYTQKKQRMHVIFPGGFVDDGPYLYVVYGKDDKEMWVATIDKEQLKASMKPITAKP